MPEALNSIRILEMTTAVAGPIAGHVLADAGAEVIKVEEPSSRAASGRMRTAPPVEGAPDHPWNRVPGFNELNRSKRIVSIDVAKPEGRQAFLDIAAISDAVIENFSPRVMGNLGIDYEKLKEVNPSIITVSMPAFGKTGPWATRISYGPGIDAVSGISHLTGYPDRPPGKPANFFCDQNAGVHAAFTTLAAIRHRRRTGQGQYIEMAMLEGELQAVAVATMDATMNGRSQMRMANRHAWRAPQGVYRCVGDDRWVALTIKTEDQWRALCGVIGQPELATDARFMTEADRHANQEPIDEAIEAWSSSLDLREAERLLQEAGVPAGAALKTSDLFEDPQLSHRKSFDFVDHPEMGQFPHTRTAWRSRRGNHGVSRPAPLFGEANDYVLGELLKYSDEKIAALRAGGIVVDEPTVRG